MSQPEAEQLPYFCDIAGREAKEMVPGVFIRTFWGERMLISVVDLKPKSVVPKHRHSEEQAGTVVSGEFELTIGPECRLLKAGDTYLIPANVEHGAITGDKGAKAIDVFSPVRKDYQY